MCIQMFQQVSYLVHADVALVTEHHVVALLAVGRAAHVADDVLIILDAQPLHRLDGVPHVAMTLPLQGLQRPLHRQLVHSPLPWGTGNKEQVSWMSWY